MVSMFPCNSDGQSGGGAERCPHKPVSKGRGKGGVLGPGAGEEEGGVTAHGNRIFFGDNENVLELARGGGCTTS